MAKSFLSEKLAVVLLRAAPWSLMRQNLLKIWVPENPAKQTSFFFVFFCFLKEQFIGSKVVSKEFPPSIWKKLICFGKKTTIRRKLLNLFHQSESSEEFF